MRTKGGRGGEERRMKGEEQRGGERRGEERSGGLGELGWGSGDNTSEGG